MSKTAGYIIRLLELFACGGNIGATLTLNRIKNDLPLNYTDQITITRVVNTYESNKDKLLGVI